MGTEVVLRFLIDKLKSVLGGEERARLTTELQDEFSKITSDSEDLLRFVQAADAIAETEARRFWLKGVREVVFEAEDIVDDLALKLRQHESVGVPHKVSSTTESIKRLFRREMFSTIPKGIIGHRITIQIREIHTKFQKLSEKPPVVLADEILPSASEDHPIFPPHLEEDDIVGTETAINKLLKWLEGEERLAVVSVVGIGGLGKTTLVRQVFNSPDIKNRFNCHAWVTVSQSFGKDKLLQSMIKQFDQQVRPEVDVAEHLRGYLQSKKYVIVLDDVWSIDLWEGLKHMLPDTRCGSRVIITTRNYEVAMATYGHVYNLQLLTSEDAWSLFCKKAFPSDAKCPQELEESSRYVVTRCGGLPLAIAVAGSFFSTKRDLSEWKSFIDNLGSKLESNPYVTTLIRVIKLSYDALPYNLKFCFLYLGIFPKDVPIRITRLIRLWIAEGCVQVMEGNTREEVALGYLNELVRRSLVRVSEFHDDGRLGSCQIHDLIRDMILLVVREVGFFIRYSEEEDMRLYGRARRLSINDNFAGGLMLERSHLHLRSLLVFGKERIFGSLLAEMGVRKFRFLRVLDLEGTLVDSLPDEIGNLLHLRYLSLRNTMITSLPKSFGKLVNIETLDLKGTRIDELTIEILKLKFLRHLIVSHHDMNGVPVPKGIGELSALQTLTCIDVASDQVAVVSELGNLIQMMRLCIANLRTEDGRTLCSSIEKMNRLISFKVMSKDDNQSLNLPDISPTPPRLQRIYLNGRLENLPGWIASLHELVKMSLFGSRLSDDPLKILRYLPNLVVLTLEAAYDGEELCCQEGLPKLKVLKLARLDGLKAMRVGKGAMPCLQKLGFYKCGSFEKVPFGIEHLTCLQELYLMKVPAALTQSIASKGGKDYWKIKRIPLVQTEAISTPAGV